MKRQIIHIDEEKCNGCGACASGCPEGAIQVINGKARLVNELFCDGLGACIGTCPEGAITIEERDAAPYDERMTMENIVKAGRETVIAHLKHLKEHGQHEYLHTAMEFLKEKKMAISPDEIMKKSECGCPGSRTMELQSAPAREGNAPVVLASELRNWPVQLQLVNPQAAYFDNADVVCAADCVPFSFANFHQRFLKGKVLLILCPKLDRVAEAYIEKLADILKGHSLKSLAVVHMEVPCCFGLVTIVEEAVKKSGKTIPIKEYTISLQGEIA